jgi:DNA-binding transcriptional regulator YiaG
VPLFFDSAALAQESVSGYSVSMAVKAPLNLATDAVRELKIARTNGGFSIHEIAGLLGCSPVTLRSWEAGRRFPSLRAALWIRENARRLSESGVDFVRSRIADGQWR